MASLIAVKHNIEVAHRLYELPGKCENIHGHSMWVTLYLDGDLNVHGILEGIEFGDLKQQFRNYLDSSYDHRLLLNRADPWSEATLYGNVGGVRLPGLNATPGDPTTENIAKWIYQDMAAILERTPYKVEVWETSVNCASHGRDL